MYFDDRVEYGHEVGRSGLGLSVGRRLSPAWRIIAALRVENADADSTGKVWQTNTAAGAERGDEVPFADLPSGVAAGVGRRDRAIARADLVVDTRRGSCAGSAASGIWGRLRLEQTQEQDDGGFAGLSADLRAYRQALGGVLAGRLWAGVVEEAAPFYDRIYLGGLYTVRGVPSQSLSAAEGGTWGWVASCEYRAALAGALEEPAPGGLVVRRRRPWRRLRHHPRDRREPGLGSAPAALAGALARRGRGRTDQGRAGRRGVPRARRAGVEFLMGRRRSRAVAALVLLAFAAPARAEDPAVVAVEPARRESLLVCRLRTQGLPGEKILSTLHSGLASAIDFQLEVAAADGRVVASRVVRLRLVYDLWEEVFVVTHDGAEARIDDDDALAGWLAEPPWLPVAPLAALAGSHGLRLRAGLRLHTIDPSERTRLEEVVAGPEDHEVSVGLGTLIRFFYKGGRDDDDTRCRPVGPLRPRGAG